MDALFLHHLERMSQLQSTPLVEDLPSAKTAR